MPILGFDELLLQIYEEFNQEHMEYEDICQKIRLMSEKNCDAFQKSMDKIKQDYDVSRKQMSSAAQSGDISGIVTAIAYAEKSKSAEGTEQTWKINFWQSGSLWEPVKIRKRLHCAQML